MTELPPTAAAAAAAMNSQACAAAAPSGLPAARLRQPAAISHARWPRKSSADDGG